MSYNRQLSLKKDDTRDNASKVSSALFDEDMDAASGEDVTSPRSISSNNTLIDHPTVGASGSMVVLRGGLKNPSRLDSPAVASRHGSVHSDNSDEDDDDDDDGDVQAAPVVGLYDPSEYDSLQASEEIKEVFQMILRYSPQNPEIEYTIYPFVPDFIPAVGDIDAFLKIPRPDGKDGNIGLDVLDEPSANQSEPAVLHLQLRAVAKNSSKLDVVVKKVEGTEKHSKVIDQWIKDIGDLHLTRPPPTVHYTRAMPDTDGLMQQWPAEFEQELKETGLPPPDLECNVAEYADVLCNLFDIPTNESKIESLHALFTLYSALKNSQHHHSPDLASPGGRQEQ